MIVASLDRPTLEHGLQHVGKTVRTAFDPSSVIETNTLRASEWSVALETNSRC